jgi:hypothetical protein
MNKLIETLETLATSLKEMDRIGLSVSPEKYTRKISEGGGNGSYSVNIPVRLSDELNITKNEPVTIQRSGNSIIITLERPVDNEYRR